MVAFILIIIRYICKEQKKKKQTFAKTTAANLHNQLHTVRDEDLVDNNAPLITKKEKRSSSKKKRRAQ